ncbi:hypothetical protein D1012_04410 [Pseudotabrizicola alkalilacus]|uniref:LVIVD repeat-containing protein n=2 Tax=Pseudotabrizicola alkalilacus TaxID=2305252 RepID=A0A411Z4V9_9RHOB|nr:hypothetical protein D1012_04410 [Pseudotabrizicola alkalilacus]
MSGPDGKTAQYARNMRLIGHCDQGGRSDGTQIMVADGFAYVAHIFSQGFSVLDVRDPTRPKTIRHIAAPANTWTLHLQQADGLLLVVHAQDQFRRADIRHEADYYKADTRDTGKSTATGQRDYSAGMAVYDLSDPADPRQIGFMAVNGIGLHRIWYVGGRWAYASAQLEGFSDFILITIDMADPTRPEIVGRFWLPGMNIAAGEVPDWPLERGRYSLHHPIVHDDIAYCGWRDGCLVIVDLADKSAPKLLAHRNWAPPFGGGTHNCLPLPDRDLLVVVDEAVLDNGEDGDKPIWLFDIRDKTNPVSISTLPKPSDRDYLAVGGHFGPHNIHENRPGSFVSSSLIFSTWQNGGLRIHDISDAYAPREVGAFVPHAPARHVDPRPDRPLVINTTDVFVDKAGLIYFTDFSGGGLHIAEFTG